MFSGYVIPLWIYVWGSFKYANRHSATISTLLTMLRMLSTINVTTSPPHTHIENAAALLPCP